VWRAALAVLATALVLPPAGCRVDATAPAGLLPPRVSPPLSALYRYTTWELDDDGGKVPGSATTGADSFGYCNVTVVGDSSEQGETTLAFRFTPEGDIYQHG